MGFRFRKSKNLGPLRVTASKGGIGLSVGVKGARVGVGADGKIRSSIGIPGTGISYQSTHSAGRHGGGVPARSTAGGCLKIVGIASISLIALMFAVAMCGKRGSPGASTAAATSSASVPAAAATIAPPASSAVNPRPKDRPRARDGGH